jgi:hypothetical protein
MGHTGKHWEFITWKFCIEKSAEHSTRAESCLAEGRKNEKVKREKQERKEKERVRTVLILILCFSLFTFPFSRLYGRNG